MAQLRVARATAQTYKTRILALIEDSKKEENQGKPGYANKLSIFRDHYKDTRDDIKNLSVSEADVDTLVQEVENEANFLFDIEDAIADLRFHEEEHARRGRKESTASDDSQATSMTRAKLPTLTLSTFDGDYLKFTGYWSSFTSSVDKRADISVVDKFNYLYNSLINGSNSCIAGLERTEENYKKAKERVYSRFGDVQMRINAHFRALEEVKVCGLATASLRANLDTIETHLGNIESLGEKLSDRTLLSMLKGKFPASIIISVEETLGEKEELTVDTFRAKLHRFISIRERCEGFQPSNTASTTTPERNGKRPLFNRSVSNPSTPYSRANNSTDGATGSARKPANSCIFCGELHWNDDCPKFATVAARKTQIRGRCYSCFSRNHRQETCNNTRPCRHCGSVEHHRSLCESYLSKLQVNLIQGQETVAETDPLAVTIAVVNVKTEVYLPSALVVLGNEDWSNSASVKMLMDTGSQMSFVSQRVARLLGLKPTGRVTINLYRFGASVPVSAQCPKCEVRLRVKGNVVKVAVIIVPYVTNQLFSSQYYDDVKAAKVKYPHLDVVSPKETANVEFLIGANLYYYFILPRLLPVRPGLFLSETRFGWLLVGQERVRDLLATDVFTFLAGVSEVANRSSFPIGLPSSVQVAKLWDLDTLGIGWEQREEEDEAVRSFNRAVAFENNRYQVSWPWRQYPPQLPTNFGVAFGRLKSLINRLRAEGNLETYARVFTEQLENDVIERVDRRAGSGVEHYLTHDLEHYLPHHHVVKEGKTTSLRVVFDASSKARKGLNSLNDCLYKGRVLLEDLLKVLLRFRLYGIALVADIEKAFLQLELKTEEDKDVVRFLWLKDPARPVEDSNLQIYRFRRVVFGVVTSPFLLNAIIRCHITKAISSYPELEPTLNAIYVDNLLISGSSIENFERLYVAAKLVFNEASMNLREWYTNSAPLRKFIEPGDLPDNDAGETGVLGLRWAVDDDVLRLNEINCRDGPGARYSKATVLQVVASIYDPLGFLSPVTLAGKLFVRKLWTLSYDWDRVLDTELTCEWLKLCELLKTAVAEFRIPRWLGLQEGHPVELHCFVDASQQAYATVVYVRINLADQVSTALVFSKARVAPLETKTKPKLTIPRLELLGATIGARAIETIRNVIPNVERTVLWSDSQCVLKWLETSRILPVFEENRLRQIKSVKQVEYRYVPTEDNPADIATRDGVGAEIVSSHKWAYGPEFLRYDENRWPEWKAGSSTEAQEEWSEVFSGVVMSEKPVGGSPPFNIDISKYGSASKLLRVTAYCVRFVEANNKRYDSKVITANEIERALFMWIEHVQHRDYAQYFVSGYPKTPHPLHIWLEEADYRLGVHNRLSHLMRCWTGRSVLRCATRLGNAALTVDDQNPILLPNRHPFTHLIIFDTHVSACHAGILHTLALVRERFCIPKGRSEVRKVLLSCLACSKATIGPYVIPPMAPFPMERVNRSPPFSYVGLDGLGPFMMKVPVRAVKGNPTLKFTETVVKAYILIITCLATRAIYLVLLEDLTAPEFLAKLREFIGRRTCPAVIVCDNARSFKAVAGISNRAWLRLVKDDSIAKFSVEGGRRITWRFIPTLSPWSGGVYERLIALFKNCYRRTIGHLVLARSQLEATIGEIQGILNSRPLCELNENEFLTPNHFLNTPVISRGPVIGHSTGAAPSTQIRFDLLASWRRGQRVLDMFWRYWRSNYLRALGERRNWRVKQNRVVSTIAPRIGEAVLIGDNLPRQEWRVGIITKLYRGSDGFIRSALVKSMQGKLFHRSVGHLYPYEARLRDITNLDQSEQPSRLSDGTLTPDDSNNESQIVNPEIQHPLTQSKGQPAATDELPLVHNPTDATLVPAASSDLETSSQVDDPTVVPSESDDEPGTPRPDYPPSPITPARLVSHPHSNAFFDPNADLSKFSEHQISPISMAPSAKLVLPDTPMNLKARKIEIGCDESETARPSRDRPRREAFVKARDNMVFSRFAFAPAPRGVSSKATKTISKQIEELD